MLTALLWIGIFFASIVVLIFAANKFIESAEKIGLGLNISPFIIGVTIVAMGTSLPELITSVIAVFKDSPEIVLGNVVGSNITNISLIIGISAVLVKRMDIEFDLMKVEIPILLFSALLSYIMMMDGVIDSFDGLVLLMGLLLFLVYTVKQNSEDNVDSSDSEKGTFPVSSVLIFVLSGIAIYFSADYNVKSIIKLSEILNISKEIISVTVVSFGTSLPEIVVSIAAAKRGRYDLSIGNIVGSNIFNTFAVLGIPSLIAPLAISGDMMTVSMPIMMALTFLFFIFLLSKKINRWQGWILILFYSFFILTNLKSVL